MDADGRHVRVLTDFGFNWAPTWSPDGRLTAFENSKRRYRLSRTGVWVVPAGTGRARRLTGTKTDAVGPSWSPDGRRIAYLSRRPNEAPAVFTMAADGTNKWKVTSSSIVVGGDGTAEWSPEVRDWGQTAWSPNGRWIAVVTARFIDDDYHEGVLGMVRPDGTGVRRLAAYRLVGEDFMPYPVWSPDSRRVAWATDSFGGDGPVGLQVFNLRGSLVWETEAYDPVWSPDGRWIAVWRNNGVALLRADGTKVRRLPRPKDTYPYPRDWSPNGRRLLINRYSSETQRTSMVVVRLDGRLVRTLRAGYEPDWFGPAPTRTTVNAAPEPVAKGKRLTVTGKVTKVGVGLYPATVKIRFKADGARRYTTVRTTTTSANGDFRKTVTARRTGTWKAVHPATAATFASHGTDRVTVRGS